MRARPRGVELQWTDAQGLRQCWRVYISEKGLYISYGEPAGVVWPVYELEPWSGECAARNNSLWDSLGRPTGFHVGRGECWQGNTNDSLCEIDGPRVFQSFVMSSQHYQILHYGKEFGHHDGILHGFTATQRDDGSSIMMTVEEEEDRSRA